MLLLTALAVYGNALPNPFLIDDHLIIVEDPRIAQFDVRGIFGQGYWPLIGGRGLYRPLTLLSLAANHAISQAPWTFRVPNLLVHVAAGIALYRLVLALASQQRWPAIMAGLLFIVHPINSMALNQVVDRADLVAAACVLWAAWLYLVDQGHGWVKPTAAALLFAIGLLSKENAATLLGVFVVLDLYQRSRGLHAARDPWWRVRGLRYYLPLGAMLGAYLLLRFDVLGSAAQPAERISPLDNVIARPDFGLQPDESVLLARWGTPLTILARAAKLLVWPHPLAWDYSYAETSPVQGWGDARLWAGLAVIAGGASALVISWRRRRRVMVAVGFMLATYGIVSNFVVVIASAFAERYVYLPSAGFCLLAGLVVSSAMERLPAAGRLSGAQKAAGWCAAVGVLVVFASLTIQRNRDFVSELVLNSIDTKTHPRAARMQSALALEQLKAGKYREAVENAQRALQIYPPYPDAWRTMGLALFRLNDLERAAACLRESFKTGGKDIETANVHLAKILTLQGDYAGAISLLEEFAAGHAKAADARNNVAFYLLTSRAPDVQEILRARRYAEEAVTLKPNVGAYLDTYVSVLEALGANAEARRALTDGLLKIPPDDPDRPGLLRRI